jgi:hypothetical protein
MLISAPGMHQFFLHYQAPNMSTDSNKITNRTTPNIVGVYKIALQLLKTFDVMLPEMECILIGIRSTPQGNHSFISSEIITTKLE